MLESIGLENRDHDVYRALLVHPGWDMADIGQNLGMGESEVRDTLDRLTRFSLLRSASGAEALVPASPELGLLPLLQDLEAELDERRARLSRDRAMLTALTSEYTARRVQNDVAGVERLVGLEAVRSHLAQLAQGAASEVRAFMPGPALSQAALDASRPLDVQNLARGVRMQTIYLETVRKDPATVEYATWFAEQGGQTRTMPSLPMRLILCDRSVAVLPVKPDASGQGAFVIRLTSIVSALNQLFDLTWERATPLGEASAPHCDGPSERELALLRMLEDGHTDEVIARKLGVSIRTVRRLMSDLLKTLNAESRFQAGVQAARRGWI
ncbi:MULTISPECIES: helix-turn-helix transcriptional regulator [unclassified Streptomyces]|uniref:helix-turn-helix transcriptional regulator n=1 Tax=unclassified Streptomyces TaxID=2593676 RepID=UPI002E0EF425|nr:LuxR C-terminal-related transcriptional regulator [Streptomyces sp. NBC_01233]